MEQYCNRVEGEYNSSLLTVHKIKVHKIINAQLFQRQYLGYRAGVSLKKKRERDKDLSVCCVSIEKRIFITLSIHSMIPPYPNKYVKTYNIGHFTPQNFGIGRFL